MHDVIFDALLVNGAPEMHHAFLGALIGGLFGRKDAKRNAKLMEEAAKVPLVSTNVANVAEMNKAAIANGYNPMTLLQAGGLSAFSTTTTTGHNAMAAAQARAAVPSVGSVIAGAIGGTLDNLAGSLFKSALPNSKSYFPPAPSADFGMAGALGWTSGGAKPTASFSALSGVPSFKSARLATNAGAPMMPEIKAPETTNPWRTYNIDPTVPGAEAFETRYGDSEIAQTYVFALTGFDDLWYNVTGMTSEERHKAMGQPIARNVTNAFDSVKAGVLTRDPKKDTLSFGKAVFEFFEPWMGP